jgi:hypothetical protein
VVLGQGTWYSSTRKENGMKLFDVLEAIYSAENLRHKSDWVKRTVQNDYYEICEQALWIDLSDHAEYDFSDAADSSGLWLPSNMACPNIIVRDESDEGLPIVYFPRSERRRNEEENVAYTWYYTETLREPRWSGNDLTVKQNSSTFTIATAPTTPTFTTLVGEYVKFATQPGIYKILTANAGNTTFTFSPVYQGPSIDGNAGDASSAWSIRPAKTRKLSVEVDGAFDSDAVLDVYYSVYPSPLYFDDQEILLPSAQPLIDLALSHLSGGAQARAQWKAEYEKDLADTKKNNPDFATINAPVDKKGNMFRLSATRRNFFSKR